MTTRVRSARQRKRGAAGCSSLPDRGPAAARFLRQSADVVQVQTSWVAGSAPNEIATWLGCSPATTRVFQTRPVARSAECRMSWEGWSRIAPANGRGIDSEWLVESRAALRRAGREPASMIGPSGCSESRRVGRGGPGARFCLDEDDVMRQRRAVESVDTQADQFPPGNAFAKDAP